MSKQFVSKNRENMLRFDSQSVAKYSIFPQLPELISKLSVTPEQQKNVKNLCAFIKAIDDQGKYISSQYLPNNEVRLNSANKRRPVLRCYNSLLYASAVSTENFKTANNAKNKNYYESLHNKKESLLGTIEYLNTYLELDKFYPAEGADSKGLPLIEVSGTFIITCLNSLSNILRSIQLPTIDFADFTLQDFQKIDKSIDNKKLYYIVYNDSFLALTRTRHGRTLFEWGLTKNINQAFLFSGNIEDYGLYYPEKSLSKIFVEVQVRSVTNADMSALTQELNAQIERRDINKNILGEAPTSGPKPNKL